MFLILLKYLRIYLFIWRFWFTIYKITRILLVNKEHKVNITLLRMKLILFLKTS